MSPRAPLLLVAGGTGGHLFPAQSLAYVLQARGWPIHLITDQRAQIYAQAFPADDISCFISATPLQGSFLGRFRALIRMFVNMYLTYRLLRQIKPACVVGFGGYPTVPPLLVASLLRYPTLIHEQNAVIGRANRFLASYVAFIAHGFPALLGLGTKFDKIKKATGNPVRPSVLQASYIPYPPVDEKQFRIVVTGGSQGAHVMTEIVPQACKLLSSEKRLNLHITHQTRSGEEEEVTKLYRDLGISHEVSSFFLDLPQHLAQAHLVIARAGASTLSELMMIGRPSLLVPFPLSFDQDQAKNAQFLVQAGGAYVVKQDDFTPEFLAPFLENMMENRILLKEKADICKRMAIPDSTERLADLVESLISQKKG